MRADAAIFFDNEPARRDEVSAMFPQIEVPFVPHTEVERFDANGDAYQTFPKINGYELLSKGFISEDNAYYRLTESQGDDAEGNYHPYDEPSGLNEEHLRTLQAFFARCTREGRRAPVVIFDWDRTITKFEGVYSTPENPTFLNLLQRVRQGQGLTEDSADDQALEYLVGGRDRIAFVRQFFELCRRHNATLVILTNNGSCHNASYIRFITRLLQMPFRLICSADYQVDGIGKKDIALRDNKEIDFSGLIAARAGAGAAGAGAAAGAAAAGAAGAGTYARPATAATAAPRTIPALPRTIPARGGPSNYNNNSSNAGSETNEAASFLRRRTTVRGSPRRSKQARRTRRR